jgi:membrane protein
MHWRSVGELLKETFQEWNRDKASRLAAALAYYTIFSIAPLLMIAIAVAGAVFGEEAAKGEIVAHIQGLVGEAGAKVVQIALANVNQTGSGIVGTIIGVATLLLGATGIFGGITAITQNQYLQPILPSKILTRYSNSLLQLLFSC